MMIQCAKQSIVGPHTVCIVAVLCIPLKIIEVMRDNFTTYMSISRRKQMFRVSKVY